MATDGFVPAFLVERARTELDPGDPQHRKSLRDLADELLELPDLSRSALRAIAANASLPLELRVATKLVESRGYLRNERRALRLGVVFAMWGEKKRLRPRSPENPTGEDALRAKLDQLEWATAGTNVDWTVYAVDDGCPEGSGRIAQEIAASHPLGESVRVLFLADSLPVASGPLAGLATADDSRKGGAVILGCQRALADGVDAVLYTDADGSVDLGQVGLLIEALLERGVRAVLGTRKHAESILVKQEDRWGIGIKLLRHMQRSIAQAIVSRGILDTQAAFKLYQADLLREMIADPTVYDFSFDTDWILATIAEEEPLEIVPFAFIDSFAESASIVQGPMTTWEILLLGLVRQVRRHGIVHDEEMARVVEAEIRSSRDLDLLIHHLPPELQDASPEALGDPDLMPPPAVERWIRRRKAEEEGGS